MTDTTTEHSEPSQPAVVPAERPVRPLDAAMTLESRLIGDDEGRAALDFLMAEIRRLQYVALNAETLLTFMMDKGLPRDRYALAHEVRSQAREALRDVLAA